MSTTTATTNIETGLSVILPVCGQGEAASKAIPAWINALEKISQYTELIVIDDGSLTNPPPQKEGTHRFKIIPSGDQKGYGHGLHLGLAEAKYSLVFLTALDQPFPVNEIGKLIHEIDYKAEDGTIIPIDIVNVHRKGVTPSGFDKFLHTLRNGFERILLGTWPLPKQGWLPKEERWVPRAMRLWYGIRIHDPASRNKLIRRTMLNKMIVQSQGSFATLEILAKANFLGAMIGETLIADKPSPFNPQPLQEPDTRKADEKKVWKTPKFVLNVPKKSETPIEAGAKDPG